MQRSPKLCILYLLRTDEAWHLEYIFSLAEGEKRKAFLIYIIIAVGPRCCWGLSPLPCSFQRDTSQHFRQFLSSSQCLALPAPSPSSLKLVKTTRPQSWWKPNLHWVCMTGKGRTVSQLCVALGMKNVIDHWAWWVQSYYVTALIFSVPCFIRHWFLNLFLFGFLVLEIFKTTLCHAVQLWKHVIFIYMFIYTLSSHW